MRRVVWVIEKAKDWGDFWVPARVCFSSDAAVKVWKRMRAANQGAEFRVISYVPEPSDG